MILPWTPLSFDSLPCRRRLWVGREDVYFHLTAAVRDLLYVFLYRFQWRAVESDLAIAGVRVG